MVIVGVLVSVAVPKYNASLERARALEGMLDLEKLSSEANAFYVINGNTYPTDVESRVSKDEISASTYFNAPSFSLSNSNKTLTISISRKTDSGYSYTLQIVNTEGNAANVTCPTGTDCGMININLSK